MRPTLSLDYDGCLHEHAAWRPGPHGAVDADLIRKAHAVGFAVVISTANIVPNVARALRAEGFTVIADDACRFSTWDGGPQGTVVLVTNRKVSASAYADDRAIRHAYGDSHEATLDAALALAAVHLD